MMENISASDEAMVLTVLDVKWEEILEEREREKNQKNNEGGAESDMSTDSASSSQESGQASNPGGKKKSGRVRLARQSGKELGGKTGTHTGHLRRVRKARKTNEGEIDKNGWCKMAANAIQAAHQTRKKAGNGARAGAASQNECQTEQQQDKEGLENFSLDDDLMWDGAFEVTANQAAV